MSNVISTIAYFPDPDSGRPISTGYVYIGVVDLDPVIEANRLPVTALQENGSQVTITQPIRTNAGGQPVYNGSPVSLFVSGNYSLKVMDSLGVQKNYIPNNNIESDNAIRTFDNIADLKAATATIGTIYETLGYYSPGDGGGARYLAESHYSADGYYNHESDDLLTSLSIIDDGIITALQCGAKKDAGVTDNWPAIQAGINNVNGELFVPYPGTGNYYRIGQALRARDGVVVRLESAETRIHCTGDGGGAGLNQWPNFSCLLLGSYLVSNINLVSAYALNAVTIHDELVTTTISSDATNFSVGDVIFTRTLTTFTIGTSQHPTWSQLNVVTSVDTDTGEIGVRHPMQKTETLEILNLSDNGTTWKVSGGADTGEAQFATKDFKMLGGWWSTKETYEQPFMAAGGSIDCHISPDRVTANNGVAYGNLHAHNLFECKLEEIRRHSTELAYSSHNNIVNIGTSNYKDISRIFAAASGGVAIVEAARNNKITIDNLYCNDFANDNGVYVGPASNNEVNIGTIVATAVTQGIATIIDPNNAGTRPVTENNIVRIGNGTGGSSSYYLRIASNSQGYRNKIIGGSYFGAVSAGAMLIDGNVDGYDEVLDVWCENGAIVLGTTVSGHKVSGYVKDGISIGTDWAPEIQRGDFSELKTESSELLRLVNLISAPGSATNASPFTKTSTISAGGFEIGDEIEIYSGTGFTSTTATAKNFLLTVAGTNVINNNVSDVTGEVIIKAKITFANNTAIIAHALMMSSETIIRSEVLTIPSLDLDNNDYDIVFTVTPSDASDTLFVRDYRTIGRKAYNVN